MKNVLAEHTARLKDTVSQLERSGKAYTTDKVVELYRSSAGNSGFLSFGRSLATQLRQIGKSRTAETYTTALNSFERFRGGNEVYFSEVDSNLMSAYELWLWQSGSARTPPLITCVIYGPYTTKR